MLTRAMLINPPSSPRLWEQHSENLGLGYLTSVLRLGGYETALFDASLLRLGIRRALGVIRRDNPDVLGFRLLEVNAHVVIRMVQELRKGGYSGHITAGGPLATMMGAEFLELCPQMDTLIIGEAEETLPELMGIIEDARCRGQKASEYDGILGLSYRAGSEVRTNDPRPLVADLDTIPFPARDTLPYVMRWGRLPMVISSRGCEGHCIFCCPSAMYKKSPGRAWRARSAGNVVDEIEQLCRQHNVRRFDFLDDNFFGDGEFGRRRAFEIVEGLRNRNLKVEFSIECRVDSVEEELFGALRDAGCVEVRLGIESGVQRILDRYGKGTTVEDNVEALAHLKEWGLPAKIGFIPFDPSMNIEELLENADFLRRVGNPEAFNYNRVGVSVGTPLERLFEREGRLRRPAPWSRDYSFDDPGVVALWRIVYGYAIAKRTVMQGADWCYTHYADLRASLLSSRGLASRSRKP